MKKKKGKKWKIVIHCSKMRAYIASLENNCNFIWNNIDSMDYCLISFLYLKEGNMEKILQKVNKGILIDSGAFSFQHGKGKKMSLEQYTDLYCDFVKKYTSNPKIEGFFEMDIDNVIGYEEVLKLRKKLDDVSDKIIYVWHRNRSIEEFYKMCDERKGKKIAITGFNNGDIKDSQYNLFINEAHRRGCSIHILGCTRFNLIKDLNLGYNDSVDSSSWKQSAIFGYVDIPNGKGGIYKLSSFKGFKTNYKKFMLANFLSYKMIQDEYEEIDNSIPLDKLVY
jgi:hypothetical protein